MKMKLTLLPIDDEISGFEIGEFYLFHEGNIISSEHHQPNQSIMIFIFLSSLLDELKALRAAKRNSWCVVSSANSSFTLYLEKKNINILIRNNATTIAFSFQAFCDLLYSSINSWLRIVQPKMDPVDGALCDLLESMRRFSQCS